MSDDARPHSERYFTDARDYWWHADYLALVIQRLGLGAAPRVLEVGVGQGHFARAVAPHLGPGFDFVGLDPEPKSLATASARCEAANLPGTFAFVEGRAEALPFPDATFDFVICQTLLIHLADPAAGFAEMVRVCRPGGRILACEPNNLAAVQTVALATGPDPFLEARFVLRCTRGKARLGLGDNNFGIQLPRLFAALADVTYANNDRPLILAPPYARPEERCYIDDLRAAVKEQVAGWSRDVARRYYLAGFDALPTPDAPAAAFEADYDALLEHDRNLLASIDAGQHLELLAPAMLIATGRRPLAP
jgi:SAM-dependent methyltransferase